MQAPKQALNGCGPTLLMGEVPFPFASKWPQEMGRRRFAWGPRHTHNQGALASSPHLTCFLPCSLRLSRNFVSWPRLLSSWMGVLPMSTTSRCALRRHPQARLFASEPSSLPPLPFMASFLFMKRRGSDSTTTTPSSPSPLTTKPSCRFLASSMRSR